MSRLIDTPGALPEDSELFRDPALGRQALVMMAQQLGRTHLTVSAQWHEEGHTLRGPLNDPEALADPTRKLVLNLEMELDDYEAATTPGVQEIKRAVLALLGELEDKAATQRAEASALLTAQRLSLEALNDPAPRTPRRSSSGEQAYSALRERYRSR